MERLCPFPCQRVHYQSFVPVPNVQFLELDENENENVKEFTPQEFYKEHPLAQKSFSLQELIDAGIPLKQIDTHLYESRDPLDRPWSPVDLLDDAKFIAEQMSKEKESVTKPE